MGHRQQIHLLAPLGTSGGGAQPLTRKDEEVQRYDKCAGMFLYVWTFSCGGKERAISYFCLERVVIITKPDAQKILGVLFSSFFVFKYFKKFI